MKQAMIFAAGLGTRLKPLTDTMPKALVRVGGEPLLKHVVLRLKDAGFTRIVVNVHHFAQQIVDYLKEQDNFGMEILISDESDRLLDTGGGIRKALPLFDPQSPILIHNVDILSNANLSELYEEVVGSWYGAGLLVSQRQTKRYLIFDDEHLLKGWKNIETGEKKALAEEDEQAAREGIITLTPLAFSGIHVLAPRMFPHLRKMPDRFSIIDFYLEHCYQEAIRGKEQKDLRLMDVGKLATLAEAEAFLV